MAKEEIHYHEQFLLLSLWFLLEFIMKMQYVFILMSCLMMLSI